MRNNVRARAKRSRPSHTVQSVDRALRLLDLLGDGTAARSLTECSRAMGLSKAVVFRLVRTLERHGYLMRNDDRRYMLGTKPLELASVVLRRFEVRQVARPTVLALAERTGESVVLTAPGRDGVVCLDTVDSPQRIRVSFQVGRITPYHAGAAGKVHLAYLPEARIRQILARGLPAFTERTITDPGALRRDLARIRRQGYAFTVGEFDPGVAAISAPIVDSRNEVVAVISLGGPAERFSRRALPRLVREVKRAAEEISIRLLGGRPTAGEEAQA